MNKASWILSALCMLLSLTTLVGWMRVADRDKHVDFALLYMCANAKPSANRAVVTLRYLTSPEVRREDKEFLSALTSVFVEATESQRHGIAIARSAGSPIEADLAKLDGDLEDLRVAFHQAAAALDWGRLAALTDQLDRLGPPPYCP